MTVLPIVLFGLKKTGGLINLRWGRWRETVEEWIGEVV